MAFVQYDPLIQHGEAKSYDDDDVVLMDDEKRAVKSNFGQPSKQFRGWVAEVVMNKANGRWMYKLRMDRKHDKTGAMDSAWFYQDDLIEVKDE